MDSVIRGLAAGTVIVGLFTLLWERLGQSATPTDSPARQAVTEATVPIIPCESFLAEGGALTLILEPSTGLAGPGQTEIYKVSNIKVESQCMVTGQYSGRSLMLKACQGDGIFLLSTGNGITKQGQGTCTADKATGTLSFTDDENRLVRNRFTLTHD